ncbi:AAA family ATPase [Kribbella sp. NPDC050124]|uniref:AAA family ATPase n=1 Tax=Kribbella sp. NPDC050124 TaxID=3364114 RepID=UPI0037A0B6F5
MTTNFFGDGRTSTTCSLGKRTFVYGRNGTGKSTFSEVLRQLGTGQLARTAVQATYWDSGKWASGALPASVVERIHVYNRFYVGEALQFFLDGRGESVGILKLGRENVEAEKLLRETEQRIEICKSRVQAVEARQKELRRSEEKQEKDVKDLVIGELRPVDPARFNPRSYTVREARHLLESTPAASLDSDGLLPAEEVQLCRDILRSDDLPPLGSVSPPDVDAPALRDAVLEAVGRSLASVVLAELQAEPVLARWIEAGLSLHDADAECRFCHAGVLSQELRDSYAAHFDDSQSRLREDLSRLQQELTAATASLELWLSNLPSAGMVLPAFTASWQAASGKADSAIRAVIAYLDSLAALLKAREADIHSPLTGVAIEQPPELAFEELVVLAELNDRAAAEQAVARNRALQALMDHAAAPVRPDRRQIRKLQPRANRALVRLDAQLRRLSEAAQGYRDGQQDVGPMAQLINQDLVDYFGHVHLRLAVTDEGRGYRVLRNGEAATNLSEGERNAIAILYFLRSLEADGITPADDLVVIDDPVTSLDKDALFATFGLVLERTEDFGQVVQLTHDFDYFKLNLMKYSKIRRKSIGIIKNGDSQEKAYPAVQFLETVARSKPSGERSISLRPLSPRLLDHPTEYHFLFYRIGDALISEDEDDLPLLGNAARRLLEGFISFKAPNQSDFAGAIEAAGRSGDVPSSLVQRIVRFVHASSHRGDPNPSASFDSASVPDELGHVLRFMHTCDSDHFVGMCKAVGLDHDELVAT